MLTVTRNEDGATGTTRAVVDDTITEVLHRMFRLDIDTINIPSMYTDVHFDVETFDTLERILGELGLDVPSLS